MISLYSLPVAFAATLAIPPLPTPEYDDAEVVTNVALTAMRPRSPRSRQIRRVSFLTPGGMSPRSSAAALARRTRRSTVPPRICRS